MVKLYTERLTIIALDECNLNLSIENFNKMEKNLGLSVTDKNIGIREKNVFKIRLHGVKNHPKYYMWYTTWMIVLKNENRIVGHVMLKGYPNKHGEVNIGYYMQEKYRHKGIMIEALKELINWIFLNSDVKFITADTLKSNIPTQILLRKLGMFFYKEDDECFWWRLGR